MSSVIEENNSGVPEAASNLVRMKMLQQMAEALEDEASSLLLRAASFEEEEVLLNRQIEDHQTEINRLQLKLDSALSDQDGLLARVQILRDEASAMREEAYNNEDEIALSAIDDVPSSEEEEDESRGPIFFQRPRLTNNSASR